MAQPLPRSGNFPVPLDQPLYNASFGQAIKRFFTKYATFSGRASRSEYWWAVLFNTLVYIFASIILGIAIFSTGDRPVDSEDWRPSALTVTLMVLFAVYGLAVLIPSIAVSVRRLHDANYSGWFYLLSLIPGVGGLILLIFMLLPSHPQGARFDAGASVTPAYPQVP
jgi:uncharacterized membrane protein YhaH (DUF805 family)